jgi:endonuclease/exonuclease/phosphatase family metal-dependent hydrolase
MTTSSQTSALKMVSLNIELDKNFDCIIPFLKKHQPDVILLQEVLLKDTRFLEETLKMKSIATKLCRFLWNGVEQTECQMILTHLPMTKSYSSYYRGDGENLPFIPEADDGTNMSRAITVAEIIKENKPYRVINTHFTWSSNGQPSEKQHEDLETLFQLLSPLPDFILSGDFNAPRGTAIFDAIALRYKDNIPAHITTTIDKNLHRAGDLQLVIDGLFSTPKYHVDSIELFDNLSDHFGVLAEVFIK